MGNHALRSRLGAALKARGMPTKVYRGRVGKKRNRAASLRHLIFLVETCVPGVIVCDCTGRNHVVKDFAPHDNPPRNFAGDWFMKPFKGYWLDCGAQMEFEDGRYSCGCGTSPEPPRIREEMEQYTLSLPEDWIENQRKLGWWDDHNDRTLAHLRSGGHIHDERGVLLPEWERPARPLVEDQEE